MTNKKSDSTVLMRVACAIVFWLFTFLYLYAYQADVLTMLQHVLSHGKTHYDATIGALLITAVLYLLQLGVFSLTKLVKRTHALTFFPSLLLLTVLTDVSPDVDLRFTLGAWSWVVPLLLAGYAIVLWVSRQYQPWEPETNAGGLFSRTMWINLLTMFAMFMMVGLFSNHSDVFHYRMRAENCLTRKDYDGALAAGRNASATDSSLTMLRAYALSAKGQLAERLFEYPVKGGSAALLPNGRSTRCMLMDEKNIRRQYRRDRNDYQLCGYLLDRRIDDFARLIGKVYTLDSVSLPKHYREALTLYTHLRSNPVVVYKNAVMEADFDDLQNVEKNNADERRRANQVRSMYGNTYWYYYLYGKQCE